MKRYLIMLRWLPSRLFNYLLFKVRKVNYASFPHTFGCLMLRNKGQIQLGHNVALNSSLAVNPTSGFGKTVLVTEKGGKLTIDDNVGISNAVIFCAQSIHIGKHTMIGSGTKIYDNDFHPLDAEQRRIVGTKGKSKAIKIGEDVFIGAGCYILKGVTIGDRSIVGAGSVVARSIPADQIWCGNPATYIRPTNI